MLDQLEAGARPTTNLDPNAEIPPYALIIGGRVDGQVTMVVDRLRQTNTPYIFLDQNGFADADGNPDFSIDISADGVIQARLGGRAIPDPAVVWCRQKQSAMVGHWDKDTAETYVTRTEWHSFIFNLCAIYRDRMLYRLSDVAYATNKPAQFRAAGSVGFKIPESTMFLGRKAALAFAEKHNSIVAKPIGTRSFPAQKGEVKNFRCVYTMDIQPRMLASASEEEFRTPTFFQRRIREGVEFRVIVSAKHVFAYKIAQSVESRVRADERALYFDPDRSVYGLRYELVPTPAFLAKAVPLFMDKLGIINTTMDVIQRPDGAFEYLECDAEGQWYAAVGRNIDEVIDVFTKHLIGRLETASPPARARRAPAREAVAPSA